MSERTPEGHPIAVMAFGGFAGGLLAGGNNAGFLGFVVLSLGASFALLYAMGHIRKETWDQSLGTLLGLSTFVPLPCGFIGMILGKAMWGTS